MNEIRHFSIKISFFIHLYILSNTLSYIKWMYLVNKKKGVVLSLKCGSMVLILPHLIFILPLLTLILCVLKENYLILKLDL